MLLKMDSRTCYSFSLGKDYLRTHSVYSKCKILDFSSQMFVESTYLHGLVNSISKYASVIGCFRVQYGLYLPSFSYFVDLFDEPLGE